MRAPGTARAGRIGAIAVLLLSPMIVHVLAMHEGGAAFAGPVVVAQAFALVWMLLERSRWRLRLLCAAGLAAGVLAVALRSADHGLVVATGLPHATAYIAFLTLFAASLLPGRESLITGVARRIRGSLTPEQHAYTRRVTWAWCIFFATQLAASAALLMWAPFGAWSLFVTVLHFPLVLLVFAIEYAYRSMRFPLPAEKGRHFLRVFALATRRAAGAID